VINFGTSLDNGASFSIVPMREIFRSKGDVARSAGQTTPMSQDPKEDMFSTGPKRPVDLKD